MALARYFILAIFVLAAGIATYFAEELLFPEKSSFPRDSLEYAIDSDLIQMKHEGNVGAFNNLKKVYLSDHRMKKKEIDWSKIFSNHFIETTNSDHTLQIDLFDSLNEKTKEEDLLIVQFSLVDEKTKNKVWELSRTYNNPKTH